MQNEYENDSYDAGFRAGHDAGYEAGFDAGFETGRAGLRIVPLSRAGLDRNIDPEGELQSFPDGAEPLVRELPGGVLIVDAIGVCYIRRSEVGSPVLTDEEFFFARPFSSQKEARDYLASLPVSFPRGDSFTLYRR